MAQASASHELQAFKAEFFKALAHPVRIRILEILVTGDVAKRLPARIKRSYARSVDLGGKTFDLHRVKY